MDKKNDTENLSLLQKIDYLQTNLEKFNIRHKLRELFSFQPNNSKVIINPKFFEELSIQKIITSIDKCYTIYGTITLENWSSQPSNSISEIISRQRVIRNLIKDKDTYIKYRDILLSLKDCERDLLWFWQEETDELKSIYDMVYFNNPKYYPFLEKYLDKITNQNQFILGLISIYKIFISPLTAVVIPTLSIIIPYIVFYFLKIKTKFRETISFIFAIFKHLQNNLYQRFYFGYYFMVGIYVFLYLQSSYQSLKIAYDTNKIINFLHQKVLNVKYFLQKAQLIVDFDTSEYDWLMNLDDNVGLFSNKGYILKAYRKCVECKYGFIEIMKKIGVVDAYLNLARLLKENERYSFVKFRISQKPYLNLVDISHPILSTPVPNSIQIKNNLLITGPNKAGKSTFIKSVAINVLLAQTIGIVSARRMVFTPFDVIDSYLNIMDTTGYESLFEAEMLRAKKYIDFVERTRDKKAFIVMDEIFTSTNFVEGFAGAYGVIKKLCQFSNSISIITTHFTELNKLEQRTGGRIQNYKFEITRNDKGDIEYTYQISKGYSTQYIALELLRRQGFDTEILEEAFEIKNNVFNPIE